MASFIPKLKVASLWVFVVGACNRGESGSNTTSASAAASSASAAPSAAPSAPAAPWYTGTWEGTFPVERHQIQLEPKLGGLKEWRDDDGKAGSGTVSITTTITSDGIARGQATGALGSLHGEGAVEDDKLTMQWASDSAEPGFSGVLSAAREGERLSGTFQSSSGNSLVVRSARVTLDKKK